MRISIAVATLLAAFAVAHPVSYLRSRAPLSPDPSGEKNIGNANGGQFITGQCLSNADCQSTCCATLGNIGICSGLAVADQQGKSGCGFGGGGGGVAAPLPPRPDVAAPAAPPPAGGGLKPDPEGEKNVGNGQGGQFITGRCLSNADCGSTCCATLGSIGICSGPAVANAQGKSGCGFNGGNAGVAAPPPPPVAATTPPPPPAANGGGGGLKPDPAGEKNIGNANGGQFITGQCLSNADCQSTCCATLGSIGICSGLAVANAQGKSGCGFNGGNAGVAAPPPPPVAATPPPPPPAQQGGGGGLKPDPAGEKNIGNGNGGQFITGQCLSNADCQSTCCATLGNIGICSGLAVANAQGKSGCGFRG